jgi:predicted nucleic acid-binding protein
VSKPVKLRLFLDSNVLLGGIVAEWGLDKVVLSLCAAKIVRLVLAEAVRDEIEENLLFHAQRLPAPEADKLLENYRRLIDLTNPEIVPYPASAAVRNARNMIRHEADVPVFLSAIAARPDWLLSNNTKHFTPAVAQQTGLRIATPSQFFRTLSTLLR